VGRRYRSTPIEQWISATAQRRDEPESGPQILFTVDQLRLLQDAVTRDRAVLGNGLQRAIAAELRRKGVPAAKAAPGAAFGTLETKVQERIDGDEATGTWYSYKINITFTPDTAVVQADEIALIQTVRLIETASGSNKNPDEKSKKRQTPSATNVDRRSGEQVERPGHRLPVRPQRPRPAAAACTEMIGPAANPYPATHGLT